MANYDSIPGLLEEKGYKKVKSRDGFCFYIKSIEEAEGKKKKITTRIYALTDEFPFVVWFKDGKKLSLNERLEEIVISKAEGKRKYFANNEEQRKSAQGKYLKKIVDSLKYQ